MTGGAKRLTSATGSGWMTDAACGRVAEDLWFPPHLEGAGRHSKEDKAAEAKARAVCAGCAVRERCLAFALELNVSGGIWGGLTPAERTRKRRAR